MSTKLGYGGVVTLLHGWVGGPVAVTVSHADARRPALELGGILNRGEGPAVGLGELPLGAEILYFSVGAETAGEYCWISLDEVEFVDAWLTAGDEAGGPPTLRVRSGGLDLGVSPAPDRREPA
ncbi:MAG TPA: hypothetical protein VFR49_16200 [Solirubrobacteraceae bacterium]|nr:hypothetical protein [Solirubrobacteraceae bacterium]